VEGSDVVAVAVRQRDATDHSAGAAGGSDEFVGGPRHRGVDEREAVVLADQERVDEPVAGYLDQVLVDLGCAHAVLSVGQKSGSITASPRWCAPNTTNSSPSGPASAARGDAGATRIASSGRTSLISSSILIRPLPLRIRN